MTGRYRCGKNSERNEGKGSQVRAVGRDGEGEEGLEGVDGDCVCMCVRLCAKLTAFQSLKITLCLLSPSTERWDYGSQ